LQAILPKQSKSKFMTKMNFGSAIEMAKRGKQIFREGWNGKGMFVYLQKGSTTIKIESETAMIEGVNINLFDNGAEGTTTRLPNLNMVSARGNTITGWLASQTDILAEDWDVNPTE
jgi:hypothetical protein